VDCNIESDSNIVNLSDDTQRKEIVRTVVDVEHDNSGETDVLPSDNTVHNNCDNVSTTESVAYFLSDGEDVGDSSSVLPIFREYHSASTISGYRSPRIHAVIQGRKIPLLLDSGAECSVLPKAFMNQLLTTPTTETRVVQSFGGNGVLLEGPRFLQIDICGVKLVHAFYALDTDTPNVAGYDLIATAKLVFDSVRQRAYSYFNTNMHTAQHQNPKSSCRLTSVRIERP